MKKKLSSINVKKEEFKKIKQGKQTLIIRLNDEENKNINKKDKIIIKGKIDRFKKIVKDTHVYSNLDELINSIDKTQLGYKKKENPNYDNLLNDYSSKDIEKYGILKIELKPKKHLFRKILLGLIIIILLFFCYRLVNNKVMEINATKFSKTINLLSQERTDYVFIEINPSFVLTIKNNNVHDVACLNEDCISIYNDIDIKGKNINDGIDTIYNISKKKGFNTSNKIKVKTSNNINIDNKDYISIEHIDSNMEKELLQTIKNNENIKNVDNSNYYNKLWKELKKDSDYDKVYSCNMNNGKLHCHFTKDFIDYTSSFTIDCLPGCIPKAIESSDSIIRVLNKFNVKYSSTNIGGDILNKIIINGNAYSWGKYISGETIYDNVLKYTFEDEHTCIKTLVPITKFNLLTGQYDKKDAIIIDDYNQ